VNALFLINDAIGRDAAAIPKYYLFRSYFIYSDLEDLFLWIRSEAVGFAVFEYKIDRNPLTGLGLIILLE
jgi:hypothetical protein